MKILIIVITIFFGLNLFSQDIPITDKKPEPLEELKFKFPEYEKENLPNGMKVFFIKDDEQPTIMFSLLIPGGYSSDTKPGLTEMTAEMLLRGAGDYSAEEFAEKLDGVGASISTNVSADYTTIYAGGLKKYSDILLEMLTAILTDPELDDDEFDKLKNQEIASVQYENSNANTLAFKLTKKVIYGKNNPYSFSPTKKSLQSIELDDVEEHFKKFFVPNLATLVVTGDFDKDKMLASLENHLQLWVKGKIPGMILKSPDPEPVGVYFISRPGSVQSSIVVAAPALPFKDKNYEKLYIATSVMGGGFGSRLTRILREKHSFTYSPKAFLTEKKYANHAAFNAEVRNSVTDSSVAIILDLLKDLGEKQPGNEELERTKKYQVGKYNLALESSDFIASLIQKNDFMGVDLNYLRDYTKRLMAVSGYQISEMAKKYFDPSGCYIIVVGSPDVVPTLEKFGKIYFYDGDLNPEAGLEKMAEGEIEPKDLIEKYVEATGGEDAIGKIKSMVIKGNATYSARGTDIIVNETVNKSGGKIHRIVDFSGQKQEEWYNGEKAWLRIGTGLQQITGEDLKNMARKAQYFPIANLIEDGYKCNVLGKRGDNYILNAVSPEGEQTTIYFNVDSGLMTKKETIQKVRGRTVAITEEFSDYMRVGDLMLPGTAEVINPMFSLKMKRQYELNTEMDDSLFTPEKN